MRNDARAKREAEGVSAFFYSYSLAKPDSGDRRGMRSTCSPDPKRFSGTRRYCGPIPLMRDSLICWEPRSRRCLTATGGVSQPSKDDKHWEHVSVHQAVLLACTLDISADTNQSSRYSIGH